MQTEYAFAVISDTGLEEIYKTAREAKEIEKKLRSVGVPAMTVPVILDVDASELDLFKLYKEGRSHCMIRDWHFDTVKQAKAQFDYIVTLLQ